jgi:hypothetical protein
MFKAWIVTVGLAVPLLLAEAGCSQDSSWWKVDPVTQTAGSMESKDCATEARRMERVASLLPNNRQNVQAIPILYAQEAERAAVEGNERECWSKLGEAQAYID